MVLEDCKYGDVLLINRIYIGIVTKAPRLLRDRDWVEDGKMVYCILEKSADGYNFFGEIAIGIYGRIRAGDFSIIGHIDDIIDEIDLGYR